MLSHNHRFHRRNAINAAYKRGRKVKQGPFTAVISDSNIDHSRFAVVVSKKVDKRAVARNRIRRRVYEVVRKNLNRVESPFDVVISVYDVEVAKMPHDQLKSEIDSLMVHAGVFKPAT